MELSRYEEWIAFCVLASMSIPFAMSAAAVQKQPKLTGICPEQCICDVYMKLNRGDCSNQKFISAAIGMSEYVELLDLSYNEITVLDNQCFRVSVRC